MNKKVRSIAALWLVLLLMAFIYTDRDAYTWTFAGEDISHLLITEMEAETRENAYMQAMEKEKEEADARREAGFWGKENQYGGAPITRPAIDEEQGLNLTWGRYEVEVAYASPEPFFMYAVSAGRQPFIEDGNARFAAYEGTVSFPFRLTDSTEHLMLACDLPEDAQIHSVTVRRADQPVVSPDLLAYAALLGAVLTVLLVLSWDESEKGRMRRRDALTVIGVAAFASMPLLWSGVYDGHDLFFHLNRIEGIASGLRAGQFPVRIHASTLLGYGYASSQFYPELFLYFPAVMRNLGVSLSACVRVFEMTINLSAAAVCYASARALFGSRRTALCAAAIYMLCPYRLVNLYVRATLGESLAMIFFPLLIWAMYEVLVRDERKWPLLALSMTGIFMSHLLSTMFAVLFCALAALCAAKKLLREPERIAAIAKAAGLTALCSLWFLVPMLDYTAAGISTSVAIDTAAHVMRFGAYLVGFPGEVTKLPYEALDFSYTVGVVPGLVMMLSCALLAVRFYSTGLEKAGEGRRTDRLSLALLLLGCAALLGATELFPWDWACRLRRPFSTLFKQIQYPWRLVGVAVPLLSMAAAYGVMRGQRHRSAVSAAVIALCCVFAGYVMQVFVQQAPLLAQEDYCDTRIVQYEYTYEGTEKSALVPGEIIAGRAPEYEVRNFKKRGTNLTFTLDVPQGNAYIDLPLLYYPGYRAQADGKELRVDKGHNNVVRIFGIAMGTNYDVRVWFEPPVLWLAAQVVSLLGAALLLLALERMRRRGWKA